MRTLPPPPVSRCDHCGGELRLKGIEPDGPRHELGLSEIHMHQL
jgi:hypothetical protein